MKTLLTFTALLLATTTFGQEVTVQTSVPTNGIDTVFLAAYDSTLTYDSSQGSIAMSTGVIPIVTDSHVSTTNPGYIEVTVIDATCMCPVRRTRGGTLAIITYSH